MGTVADNKGGADFQRLESGTFAGRCYGLIDIGTQRGEYQGKETFKHKIVLLFETPNDLMDDGRPFGLAAFYTLSLHENSALRPALEAWRGKPFTEAELEGFDVKNILGHACMLTVSLTEKGKNKIVGIGKAMKGLNIPEAVNGPTYFDLDEYIAGDTSVYDTLPDWIKTQIQGSQEISHPKEYAYTKNGPDAEQVDEDSIPF